MFNRPWRGFHEKILSLVTLSLFSSSVFAYGVGQITHPLKRNGHIVSGEFTGIMSNGAGIGVQGRYTRRLKDKLKVDAGAGLGAGDRSFRIFLVQVMNFPGLCKTTKGGSKSRF